MTIDPVVTLQDLFDRALADADPLTAVSNALPDRPDGPIYVVGAGKAAAVMATAVERAWGPGVSGLVITRDGYRRPTQAIRVAEAAHPIPDARGMAATKAIMEIVQKAESEAFIVGLWSGGGSSLLVQPIKGLSLREQQSVTAALLSAGASIQDINTVRKHLSAVKGGRLASLANETPMLNLYVSDVVGDDLSVIASGPTVTDTSMPDDAAVILERFGISVPQSLRQMLGKERSEQPIVSQNNITNTLILSPKDVLSAVETHAKDNGIDVINKGDDIEGEAKEVAAAAGRDALRLADTIERPTVILSGGETTVTLDTQGQGGPNLEFCLALAIALKSHPRIWALSCDTDGIDGNASSAGALVDPQTLTRAVQNGRAAEIDLADHNSETFFQIAGGLITPGPTSTNVNDFRAILIMPKD